jgi:hypothetical protein
MMIVERSTHNIKFGHMQETIELLKVEINATIERGISIPYRIYVSRFGRFAQLVTEYEFEDLAAMEKFWTEWRPKNPEFIDKWFGLMQGEGQREIWDLVESG